MQLMAIPCIYTSATTIVRLCHRRVAGIQPVIDFGWMMTTGMSLAMVLNFLIVPSLILGVPDNKPHWHTGTDTPLTAGFARVVLNHGGTILLVASTVVVILTVVGISRLQVENRFIDYFDN